MSGQDFSHYQIDHDYWSASSTNSGNDDFDLQSMTAKGVKHLCSELAELKRESDEDFQKNVRDNYLLFFGISKGVKSMESELMLLKRKASTHKNLVQDLTSKTVLQFLQEKTLQLTSHNVSLSNFSSPSKLKAHTEHITGTLDTLFSEHRFDEAICVLEREEESSQIMQSEEDVSADEVMVYNTAIADRRAMLVHQLTLLAENPRVSAVELQKALMGLSKLGETNLATKLLLKYYHERIASGLYNLNSPKLFLHGLQLRDVSKYTFSMISQAVRSYVALHGETSCYPEELVQWTCEETEIFAAYLTKFVSSISETKNGLSIVVEAVHFAMSYCSLLESQRIIVLPCLIEHIRPRVEEVLQTHTNHYKNIISIVASTDTWRLEKYHISGVLTKCSSLALSQHLEYCLLTDSGWKFITLLQAFAEGVSPLVALHMEGSVLRGLVDMHSQYIEILEGVLLNDVTAQERAYKAVPLVERVTILANLETTTALFSCIVEDICGSFSNMRHEIDSFGLSIQDSIRQLRVRYCQQFVHGFLYPEPDNRALLCRSIDLHDNPGTNSLDPFSGYQEMYLELRTLQKLSEENHIEVDWSICLFKDLVEAVFACISSETESLSIAEDLSMDQHCINFMQVYLQKTQPREQICIDTNTYIVH
ncbi:hypothetical protein LIER_40913 [Lithospermum erythrorhizon]|uniref:Exocyst component Exo84 C-terminal domain-containing protein n=1 Tax=Lithospermum erythrorhizon TaxID=34254 RepID=A0AAV3R2X9_LITER